MKSFKISYLLGFASLLAKTIYAQNEVYVENNIASVEDKYYLIYVNNTLGEYEIYSDDNSKNQKRQASQMFVDSLVDQINSLIINNKETYQNPEVLDEIEESAKLRKRDNEESDFVYPISSVNNRVVLYGYLSEAIKNKVSEMDNVMECVENTSSSTVNYYNTNDILKEAGWNGIEVRQNADLHLSLISQGKYDQNVIGQYDTNYYYPASAGKDIDIVVLDTSFNFAYSEFSNTRERTVQCSASVEKGKASTKVSPKSCGQSPLYHGEMVSDVAGGIVHGVAKRANIYGISISSTRSGNISDADLIGGLQFIYNNMVRPYKTVVNISISGMMDAKSQIFNQYHSLIDGITKKGAIVVCAAGNEGRDVDHASKYVVPCAFESTICVGGTQNTDYQKLYEIARGSNYGSSVDIFAPFYVKTEIVKNNAVQMVSEAGTSFSTPIISGMIATIMSDNSSVRYTRKTIFDKLYGNSKSEVVYGDESTGIFANNGKHIVYSMNNKYNGCGKYAGNTPCTGGKETTKDIPISTVSGRCGYKYGRCSKPDECCSQYGYCGTQDYYCGANCQSSFGVCH